MYLKKMACLAVLAGVLMAMHGCATHGMSQSPKNVAVLGAFGHTPRPAGGTTALMAAVKSAQDILARRGFVVLDGTPARGSQKPLRNKAAFYAVAEHLHADWMLLMTLDLRYLHADRDHAFNRAVVSLSSELLEMGTRQVLASTYGSLSRNLDTSRPARRDFVRVAVEAAAELAEHQARELVRGR